MPNPILINEFPQIHNGANSATQTKITDLLALEHIDVTSLSDFYRKIMVGQLLCKPIFTVADQQSGNGRYLATCQNFSGISLDYKDANNDTKYFIGLQVKIIFAVACNYGSVNAGTYPTISLAGSDYIPILANGKTVGVGAWSAGQSIEGCIIETTINGATVLALDLNSNVREVQNDYSLLSDGTSVYSSSSTDIRYPIVVRVSHSNPFDIRNRLLDNISSLPVGVSILEIRGGSGFETIRSVILVDKNSDIRFSFMATQSNSEPSFTRGMYKSGSWWDT